jgi:hypothetical protein
MKDKERNTEREGDVFLVRKIAAVRKGERRHDRGRKRKREQHRKTQ